MSQQTVPGVIAQAIAWSWTIPFVAAAAVAVTVWEMAERNETTNQRNNQ